MRRTSRGFSDDDNHHSWQNDVQDADEQIASADWDDIPVHDSLRALVAHNYLIENKRFISDAQRETVIVSGSGVSMGQPFIQRRERPLLLQITILALMTCIIVSGMFSIMPLGADTSGIDNAFQGLASSMVWSHQPGYFLYTAVNGDTADSVANKFHVQVGGIYELNNLYAGDEFTVGIAYKIPLDPHYGKDYQPPDLASTDASNFGNSRFGPNWWNSIAGKDIPAGSPCAPDSGNNPLGYQLTSPNWNSAWIRGFIVYGTWVYHTGVDLAAPRGNAIHAAQQGQVIWANYDATNGLGWSVKIDHCHHVSTVYGHMDKLLVSVGQYVTQGQIIGLEGSTGQSYGPHLHFMVEWNNMWVDPMPFYTSKYTISHYVAA